MILLFPLRELGERRDFGDGNWFQEEVSIVSRYKNLESHFHTNLVDGRM